MMVVEVKTRSISKEWTTKETNWVRSVKIRRNRMQVAVIRKDHCSQE